MTLTKVIKKAKTRTLHYYKISRKWHNDNVMTAKRNNQNTPERVY